MGEDRAISSASNLYRRLLCPVSERAEMCAPQEAAGAAAERGVRLHYLDAHPFEIDYAEADERDIVQTNRQLRHQFLEAQLPMYGIPIDAPRQEMVEVRFNLSDELGRPVIGPDGKSFSGQPDLVLWFKEHRLIVIFDNKFGRMPVPLAAKNYQLRAYSLMVGDPDFSEIEADRVVAAITQPWASPRVHAVEYTHEAMREARGEILAGLRACRVAEPEMNPSTEACSGCRARHDCPGAHLLVNQLAMQKVKKMPIDELERIAAELAPGVESILLAIDRRLKYLAETYPHLLKRFKAVPVGPLMVIEPKNSASAYSKLKHAGLITDEQYVECCEPSRAKIEKIVAKENRVTLEKAKQMVALALGDDLTAKPRGARLTRITDGRTNKNSMV